METAATAAEKCRKKRILDYLHEPAADGEADGSESQSRDPLAPSALSAAAPASSTGNGVAELVEAKPGLSWLAWFSWGRRLGKNKKKVKMETAEKREEDKRGDSMALNFPWEGFSTSDSEFSSDAKPNEERSFRVGMGIGMLCLLARWEAEFSKMSEIRTQMEMLLEEIKQEVPKRYASSSVAGLNDNFPSSSSDYCIILDRNNDNDVLWSQDMLLHVGTSNSATENCKGSYDNGGHSGMHKMEVELEFELERLQLGMEVEGSLDSSEEEEVELGNENIRSSERFVGDSQSSNVSKDEEQSEQVGVSASELERRLHELLHARQQERIVELESAVASSRRMLVEKDIEISRLRNAATLASHERNTQGEIIQKRA